MLQERNGRTYEFDNGMTLVAVDGRPFWGAGFPRSDAVRVTDLGNGEWRAWLGDQDKRKPWGEEEPVASRDEAVSNAMDLADAVIDEREARDEAGLLGLCLDALTDNKGSSPAGSR